MEYEKCLVELDEVLNYLVDDELQKIPIDIRQAIKEKKDKNYTWEYDVNKNLTEQNLDRKTIAMLSYINMEYLLNEEQKSLMEQIHKVNEENLEREKAKKYNTEIDFKKNVNNADKEEISRNEDVALVKVTKDKWYKRFLSFFTNIFSNKNK